MGRRRLGRGSSNSNTHRRTLRCHDKQAGRARAHDIDVRRATNISALTATSLRMRLRITVRAVYHGRWRSLWEGKRVVETERAMAMVTPWMWMSSYKDILADISMQRRSRASLNLHRLVGMMMIQWEAFPPLFFHPYISSFLRLCSTSSIHRVSSFTRF